MAMLFIFYSIVLPVGALTRQNRGLRCVTRVLLPLPPALGRQTMLPRVHKRFPSSKKGYSVYFSHGDAEAAPADASLVPHLPIGGIFGNVLLGETVCTKLLNRG